MYNSTMGFMRNEIILQNFHRMLHMHINKELFSQKLNVIAYINNEDVDSYIM